jgi:uncharacterized SAM-binding protein YcdF (DUF218 family)
MATSSHAGVDAVAARPTGRARWPRTLLFLALGALLTGLVGGFFIFAASVVGAKPPPDPRADGIVVLTGGAARIDGALQLLAEGRGQRLLISGVNPAVTRKELASTLDDGVRKMLACCVDLDREAQDTAGNATETRQWAKRKGFTSLIVVTSDYHIVRSMVELAEAMPDMRLIAYPVSNPDLHLEDWWHRPDAFALLLREYGKFLLAETRQALTPWVRTANAVGR